MSKHSFSKKRENLSDIDNDTKKTEECHDSAFAQRSNQSTVINKSRQLVCAMARSLETSLVNFYQVTN